MTTMNTSFARADDRRAAVEPPGSADTSTTRDRLALRSKGLDEHFPKALDAEAEILDLLRPRLRNIVGVLAGTENATHLREGLRGERNAHLWLLGRLLTSERPEAGLAIDDLADYFAARRGRVVVRADDARLSLITASGHFAKEVGEAISAALSGSPDTVQETAEAVEAGKAMLAAALAAVVQR